MTRTSCAVVALGIYFAPLAHAQAVATTDGVTLAQAIEMGASRAPLVRAAGADVDVARGTRLQAGLRPNPTVSFERRQEPGGTDSATEVGVEWPLDLFRRGPRTAVAEADVAVAEREADDVRRQQAAEISAAYGAVAGAIREVSLTDEVIAAASSQVELLRERVAQGSAPALERDVVEVDVRRLKAERVMQAARVDVALVRLKRLLGLAPEAPLRLTQTIEELLAGEAAASPADVAARRADVQALAARVRVADARIASLRRDARPEVSLFASYMRMDAGFPQFGFSEHGHLERVRGRFNYVTAGASVTIPLLNRQQGSIAAASAERRAAEAREESARLTAAAEVAESRILYAQARNALAVYREQVRPLARRNLEIVRETYQLGRATVFDVLAEQRRFLEAERAYSEALVTAFEARVSMARATGDFR